MEKDTTFYHVEVGKGGRTVEMCEVTGWCEDVALKTMYYSFYDSKRAWAVRGCLVKL